MDTEQQVLSGGRLASIDALRGFDMFWIIGGQWIFAALHPIFENDTTAWVRTQLTHVEWEGFRSEDLIMPLFLFIVGVVMPFSLGKRTQRGDSRAQVYRHVIARTVILFVLGMIAQGNLLDLDLATFHIFSNTLQAIAAGYFISAIILLSLGLVGQIVTTVVLLLVFWLLMAVVPVPGHGAGVLTPEGNLAIYLDKLILGRFQDGTTYTWLLSSMTFACTVMLGAMAGHVLRCHKSRGVRVLLLLLAGLGCLLLGVVWDTRFPIIKHLWTSSFVLFSAGLCYLLLALFYLVIDVLGFRKWAFGFIVIGMNAIAVYMVTRVFDFRGIGDIFVGGLEKWTGDAHDLVRAVAGFAVLWLILWWMYRKRSFIKI
ncbi:MAG: DUF5009 domain-containing protein [Phycisphaerales bacterium]|nr:MAG: DUF5009 domain-containing protein [Phycisphaerales bacterium]